MAEAAAIPQCSQHDFCMLENETRVNYVKKDLANVKDLVAKVKINQDKINIDLYGDSMRQGLYEGFRANTAAIIDMQDMVKDAKKASWLVAYSCVSGLVLLIVRYIWLAVGDHLVTIGKAILGV